MRFLISNILLSLEILLLVNFCVIGDSGAGAEGHIPLARVKCGLIVDASEEYHKIHMGCLKTNHVEEEKYSSIDWNSTMEEFEFDDNCYAECIYKGAKLLTPDGIHKKATSEIFEATPNTSPEKLKKITTGWESCIDEAEKISKSKGLDQCKMCALHDFCFIKLLRETAKQDDIKC